MLQRIESAAAVRLSPSPNYDSPGGKRSQLIVVHDVEAPLAQSYADSLAGPAWFGSTKAQTSAHYLVGPSYAIQMVAEEDRAWHCGPAGNIISIGIEQTGYAAYSRADWTTRDGLQQINTLAALMSDIAQRHGGSRSPQRATNTQIQTYAAGGSLPGGVAWCTHHQITQALGGTTHTDPDPSYPYDLLQAALDTLGASTAPRPPVNEAPNPTPPEEDDMPTAKEIVDELLTRTIPVRDPRAAEPDRTPKLADLLAETFQQASQSARDAYAVRNATEAKAIRATVDAALQDPANGDKIGLRVWAQKITGTTLGAGDILGRLFGRGRQTDTAANGSES